METSLIAMVSNSGMTLKELQEGFYKETGISFAMRGETREDAEKMARFKDWMILYF